MDGLAILIIPLIAVGIWVLQMLFRNTQENKVDEKPRTNRPRREQKPERPREEARRDRDWDRTRERERDREARRPPLPLSRRPQPARVVPSPEPLPVVALAPEEKSGSLEKRLEVREGRDAPPMTVATSPPSGAPAPAAPLRAPAPPAPPVVLRAGTVPELARILKSPASIRAAFVLNEVLGPPLSRRPRRPLDRPL